MAGASGCLEDCPLAGFPGLSADEQCGHRDRVCLAAYPAIGLVCRTKGPLLAVSTLLRVDGPPSRQPFHIVQHLRAGELGAHNACFPGPGPGSARFRAEEEAIVSAALGVGLTRSR